MAYFKDQAEFKKVNLAWQLMLSAEAAQKSPADIQAIVDNYGTDAFGGLVGADGKAMMPDGWRQIGAKDGSVDFSSLSASQVKAMKLATLKALDLDTVEGMKRAGIDDTYFDTFGGKLDPIELIDDQGYLLSFTEIKDKDGKVLGHTLAADKGLQLKVLAQYDSAGNISGLSVASAGTNDLADMTDADAQADLTIGNKFEYVLNAVRGVAERNGIEGKDISFEGYSLGGAITNSFHHLKEELADGFFKDSSYFGFDAATFSSEDSEGGIFNFGAENDPVYGLWGHGNSEGYDSFEKVFGNVHGNATASLIGTLGGFLLGGFLNPNNAVYQLLKDNAQILDQKKEETPSGGNNLVVYDDTYHNFGSVNILGFPLVNNSVASLGWISHAGTIPYSNPFERINSSVFQEQMDRDSVIVLSQLGKDLQGKAWVEDKETATSDHFGDPAFLLGGSRNDLLKDGKSDDALEGYAGSDQFKLSSGTDIVYGGSGDDKVLLEGHSDDYDLIRIDTGTSEKLLYLYDRQDHSLKELHDVEQLNFDNGNWLDWSSKKGDYAVDYNNGQIKGDRAFWTTDTEKFVEKTQFTNNSDKKSGSANADRLFGLDGNDTLSGLGGDDLMVGGDGNDKLFGGKGSDALYGSIGNDLLEGGSGDDYLSGGYGNDIFDFNVTGFGMDTVTDFNIHAGEHDVLEFDTSIFGNLNDVLNSTTFLGGNVVLKDEDSSVVLAGWSDVDTFKQFANSNTESFRFINSGTPQFA